MKKPETDRELIDLIVNTLDNHKEQYILGSWENFAKKRKQRRKLILWFTTSGIAASLLVGLIGFRFFMPGSSSLNTDSVLQQQISRNIGAPVKKDTLNQQLFVKDQLSKTGENKKADSKKHEIPGQNSTEIKNKYQTIKESQKEDKLLTFEADTAFGLNEIKDQAGKYIADHLPDTVNAVLPSKGNITEDGSSENVKHKPDTSVIYPALNLANENITPQDEMTEITRTKKIRLGVNISPGVSSTTTVSSFNYSGGISADLDLSRHFRLSTGLQVERQNVINKATDNPAWIPAGQTQAVLVGLDFPVNITWKFLIRKSVSYYVSSGISSIAYLSEKYTTTSYSQKMVGVVNMIGGEQVLDFQLENVKSTDQITEDPLSTLNFAGRVNIIFGIEQHLSQKLFLHVEPYLKFPISGLAAQNLRFTTSGITCKISF